jgi:hypothetical protein
MYSRSFLLYCTIEAPADILNNFWIQVAISLLKPPHGGFGSETAITGTKPLQKTNGYKFITDNGKNGHIFTLYQYYINIDTAGSI